LHHSGKIWPAGPDPEFSPSCQIVSYCKQSVTNESYTCVLDLRLLEQNPTRMKPNPNPTNPNLNRNPSH